MKIVPSVDGKFSKAGEFNIMFFVYGIGDMRRAISLNTP